MVERSQLGEIRREAASWVVRLADPACSADDRAAFEAWRAQSSWHDAAYEREQASWDALDRVRALRPAAGRQPDPDLLLQRAAVRPRLQLSQQLRRVAAVLALAAVLGSGFGAWTLFNVPAYATAIGERRIVVLPDNSRVELNTDSEIKVQYGRNERAVTLVRGEAMFEVAQDARPFHVRARDAQIDLRDAKLNVRLRPEGVAVTVGEGTVQLLPADGTAASSPATLAVGQEALYASGSSAVHDVSAQEIERRLAWRKGAIDLHGQSLAQAVEEFNRYNQRRIVIADESIAALRLGGYFRTNDVDGFVRALRMSFPVNAVAGRDGSVALTRGVAVQKSSAPQ